MKIAKSWTEILKAYREEDLAKVLELQNHLVRSFAARSLAVRKVTSNEGKNTPGVDKIILDSPSKKFEAIESVKNLKGYK